MKGTLQKNADDGTYEVLDDYGYTWEVVHAGTECVCQFEGPERFDMAVFFADPGGSRAGHLSFCHDGDRHEIDGIEYEATSNGGWKIARALQEGDDSDI